MRVRPTRHGSRTRSSEPALVRGIVFDLDGTLADTREVYHAAFRTALRPFLSQVPGTRRIEAEFGPSEEGVIEAFVGPQWKAATALYLDAYRREHRALRAPFPGIRRLLTTAARAGVPLGLVTGKGPHSTAITLERLGLDDTFAFVATGSRHGLKKTASIARFARTFRLPAGEIIYVGDTVIDMEQSRLAGVWPIGAAWAGTSSPRALRAAGATHVFTSPRDLGRWLAPALRRA